MNNVFEDFIAQFMKKYCMNELKEYSIHPQGKGNHKHVFENIARKKLFLNPDILLKKENNNIIIDTKWKIPIKQNKLKVSRDDYFQMFVYAMNYESRKNILLYPKPFNDKPENFEKDFKIRIDKNKEVNIKFIDLNRDLRKNKDELKKELIDLIF